MSKLITLKNWVHPKCYKSNTRNPEIEKVFKENKVIRWQDTGDGMIVIEIETR